jgi:hypothetical protein
MLPTPQSRLACRNRSPTSVSNTVSVRFFGHRASARQIDLRLSRYPTFKDYATNHPMQPPKIETATYFSTAVVTSIFCSARGGYEGRLSNALFGLLLFAFPLVFAYSFSRHLHLFASEKRVRVALWLHAALVVLSTAAFPYVTVPFWRNPMQTESGASTMSKTFLVAVLALPIFFALSLILFRKRRSSFGLWASLLLWPYLFLFSVVSSGRWFEESSFTAILFFLPFLASVLLAFSAGAVSQRLFLARTLATLASLLSLSWIYVTETRSWAMVNSWICFNLPDRELAWQPLWPVVLRILSVAALVFALSVALFRLIPEGWKVGKSQVCAWTWPAFAIALSVLAFWFLTATTPYRIPGAMDYSYYPDFQILHIEKRGLQFHEKCISLYERRDGNSFSIFADDRRLFHYRFQTNHSSGQVPAALEERAQAWTQFAGTPNRELGTIRPLRSWNADGWYVAGRRLGFVSYTTKNGRTPPPEITALFHDFEGAASALQPGDSLKDVCLGFCFDQLAAMGYLYSNHRCFNNGKTETCR